MEKNKKKGKESLIGKIIYGFLMFAPLLAILTTCAVYTMNKEIETPRQEVTVNYKYETNDVNSIDDLIPGNIYTLNIKNNNDWYDLIEKNNTELHISISIINGKIKYLTDNFENTFVDDMTYDENEFNEYYPTLNITDYQENYIQTQLYYPNENDYVCLAINTEEANPAFYTNNLNVVFNEIYNATGKNYNKLFSKCENVPIESVEIIEEENTAEKVFYRAINNVEQSNLFNWAENNALYSGVKTTTDLFSINNTFVPMLLTYWLIMSLIYILYDIVLMIFNVIHRKLHEIQESI